MHALGIDLSTDPRKAWWCELAWPEHGGDRITVTELGQAHALGARDDASLALLLTERLALFSPGPERIAGIDAPVGWPQAFIDAIADWGSGASPRLVKRPELRLRPTDRFVQEAAGLTPMSVSTDRIGSTALLCAEVLSGLADAVGAAVLDRARGSDGIAEVYPAAALRLWSTSDGRPLARDGYKTEPEARERLLGQLSEIVDVADEQARQMVGSDDALDALLCALVAGAAARGQTFGVDEPVEAGWLVPPSTRVADPLAALEGRTERAEAIRLEAAPLAAREGWIHMPTRADLSALISPVVRDAGAQASAGAAAA